MMEARTAPPNAHSTGLSVKNPIISPSRAPRKSAKPISFHISTFAKYVMINKRRVLSGALLW